MDSGRKWCYDLFYCGRKWTLAVWIYHPEYQSIIFLYKTNLLLSLTELSPINITLTSQIWRFLLLEERIASRKVVVYYPSSTGSSHLAIALLGAIDTYDGDEKKSLHLQLSVIKIKAFWEFHFNTWKVQMII